jgi:hypothetical protein
MNAERPVGNKPPPEWPERSADIRGGRPSHPDEPPVGFEPPMLALSPGLSNVARQQTFQSRPTLTRA